VRLLEEPIDKIDTDQKTDSATSPKKGAEISPGQSSTWTRESLHIWYIMALALLLRLWFNFATNHPNAYSSCDAAEYLRYSDALAKVISGQATAPMAQTLKEFVITGPSLSVFLLIANIFCGQPFSPTNSTTPLIAQSIISALTAGLIYLIARRLYEHRSALYAGLMAAIYPAFIVNSGRLYSETLGTFIECVAAFLIVRGFFPSKTRLAENFALGASLIVLQLSRSAMILLTALSLPLIFLQSLFAGGAKNWKQAFLSLALLLSGALLILAPWLIFEKQAYNKTTLVVDRIGHYNLFTGTNTKTMGFLSYPYPDGRGIEEKSFPTLIKESFKKSPARFLKLMLDKPARLLKAPWNDFRAPIGPFDYKSQVALHQVILMFSLVGMLLAGAINPPAQSQDEIDGAIKTDPLEKNKLWGRLSIFLIFALNLPYLAFITVPRYNLTAMPFLIVFAGAGLYTLTYLIGSQILAKSPKAVLIFGCCLFVFLRDDLKDIFVFGQEPIASLILVQGTDMLSKGLISTIFGLAFFASIYISISLLSGMKKTARALTILFAVLTLPLLAFPQRANGRMGEGLLTLERPGETLSGTIALPLKDNSAPKPQLWYLLLDTQDPSLLSSDVELTINGQKLNGPLIPGIAALDDWHYLKEMRKGYDYLECAYIFDCMTQPAAISNLDLRQWFYLPLPQSLITEARRRKCLNVTMRHKIDGSTRLYGAALGKDSATIPCRDLYSWEKAFYGVENDAGLTDTRYDEKVPLRNAHWKIDFDKGSEDLGHFDLNMRLLCQDIEATPRPETTHTGVMPETTSGKCDVVLPISDDLIKAAPLTLVQAQLSYPAGYTPNAEGNKADAKPLLSLNWKNAKGEAFTLPLPWLKKSSASLDIAIPCDLSKIAGSQFTLKAHDRDPNCLIKLSASPLAKHPIFGPGSLY